jgi:hypothetical protein
MRVQNRILIAACVLLASAPGLARAQQRCEDLTQLALGNAAFFEQYPDPRWRDASDIHAFYRLFMVPGMQHCTGGEGAVSFGNNDAPPQTGAPDDADHDVILALDRWVTEGVAPEKIIASGRIGADAKAGKPGTPLTRPLCAYPAVAHYKGQGDTNSAENFACVVPAGR